MSKGVWAIPRITVLWRPIHLSHVTLKNLICRNTIGNMQKYLMSWYLLWPSVLKIRYAVIDMKFYGNTTIHIWSCIWSLLMHWSYVFIALRHRAVGCYARSHEKRNTISFHVHSKVIVVTERNQGAVSIRKTVLPGMAIPMLKIRRPNGRLIFNMEIAIRR